MKYHLNQIRVYVIVTIAIIVLSSVLVAYALQKNKYLTYDYISRTLKSYMIANEYKVKSSRALAQSTSSSLDSKQLEYNKSIPVIVYHGIPEDNKITNYAITAKKFKEQLFALKQAGYSTITIDNLYSYLKNVSTSLPEKPIVITFDDGRVDAFKYADPVLKALDYKATMFIIGKYSLSENDIPYYISSKQVEEMEKNGHWDIQAHTYDGHGSYLIAPQENDGHFFSHKKWIETENRLETDEEFAERVDNDMRMVKEGIEKLLDKKVNSFAYPFGDYGQNNTNSRSIENIVKEKSEKYYNVAFFQNDPKYRYTNNYFIPKNASNSFFMIKRIIVDPEWSGTDLLDALNRSATKKLPFEDNFNDNSGWLLPWGKIEINNNAINLQSFENENGGTIILDGSRLWRDYSVKATVSSPNQTSVYVWTRFQDDDNNAACDFGNGFIHIEQTINGEKRIIKGQTSSNIKLPSGDFTVEARVEGRNIQCILNGERIVETPFLDEGLADGGIGFKTWSPVPGQAELIVKKLSVIEI